MPSVVTENDIDLSTPQLVTVGATAVEVSSTRLGKTKRSFFSLIPVTAGVEATVVFGEGIAAVNQGLPLTKGQPFLQSLDTNGRGVFQGSIQVIASGAGQVAVTELFERS